MIKTITSFFRFYYYVIVRSPKKYNIAMHPTDSVVTATSPLLFFLMFVFVSIALPANTIVFLPLFIPFIVGNLLFVHHISNKGFAILREQDRQREEIRREERERVARERARERKAQEEYYDRMIRDRARRMYEERRQRERDREQKEREEMFEEMFGKYHSRYEDWYEEPKQKPKQQPNNNLKNAMKLMGLSDGYTVKDIKSAYRRLAKVHHPDLGGNPKNFIKLTTAYDYLMERT